MKIKIEPILKNIDHALSKISKKDLNYLLILIVAGIGFLSYYFLFDIAHSYQNAITSHSNNIGSKLQLDKSFLSRNSESSLKKVEGEIAVLEKKVEKVEAASEYLTYKLSTIDYLIYDQETWGAFINKISQNAQKNHIQLINFTNKLADSNSTFGHLLDLSIVTNSSFKNSLKFMNYLESSNLVVDIHHFVFFVKKEKIITDMNLSIWGINR